MTSKLPLPVRTRAISRNPALQSLMLRRPKAIVRQSNERSKNGSASASALTTRRTPLALATASIWSEKSAATTSEFGNAFSNASVRSPVPAARSTIVFGSQVATIPAARFRQITSHPQLSRWLARSYRRAMLPNIARTVSGSRDWESNTRDYFSVISRMSLLPMISRISRRFTAIACC